MEFDTGGSDSYDVFGVGATAGVGFDWFLLPRVSVGGHVGLRALYLHRDDASVYQANTLTSGIRLHLYF
jgi:hypothetical protein